MVPKALAEVWSDCLIRIDDKVEKQHFKLWFVPLKAIKLSDNILLIQVPSRFFYEYMPQSDVNLLSETLRRMLGEDVKLEFQIKAERNNQFYKLVKKTVCNSKC